MAEVKLTLQGEDKSQVIDSALNRIKTAAASVKSVIDTISGKAFDSVSTGAESAAKHVHSLTGKVVEAGGSSNKVGKNFQDMGDQIDRAGEAADSAGKHVHEMGNKTHEAGQKVVTMNNHVNHAHSGMTAFEKKVWDLQMRLMNLTMAAALVAAPFVGIALAVKKGAEAIDDFQTSAIATAASITSMQGSTNIGENYRQASLYATALNDTMEEIDAKSFANAMQLRSMNDELVKQRVILNINNKSQVEGFTDIANAVAVITKGMGGEFQIRQEIRGLLSGEVDAHSILASQVDAIVKAEGVYRGGLKEAVPIWKAQGTLVEEIGKRLVGYRAASGDISNTYSAIKSTLETIVNKLLRAGFKDVSVDLVRYGQEFAEYLKEHEDLIGNRIRQGWLTVKGIGESVYAIFVNHKGELTVIATLVGGILKGWSLLTYAVLPPLVSRIGGIGRALWENVKMMGNLTMMAVEASKGNFSGAASYWNSAKANWMAGGKAVGEAFATGLGDEIADRANKFLALDNVIKSATGKVATPEIKNAPDLKELTKQFKERAKEIIEIEKNRIKVLEDLEQEHLQKLKANYQAELEELDKFKDAMKSILKSWDDRDKERVAAQRGEEDALTKRARLTAELAEEERKLTESWADPAEKVRALNELIPKYRELFREIKDGETAIVSQAEADRDFLIAETRIKEVIKSVAEEMKGKEEAVIKTATAMNAAEERLKSYKEQLTQLDQMVRNMAHEKTIDVKIKISGIQDLYKVQALMDGAGANTGIVNYGGYYTQGGKTYWADGSVADEGTDFVGSFATGTPYVPKTGLALVHKGERIIPAEQNAKGFGNVTIGDINVNLPPGTPQQNARETARAIYGELQKLGLRFRTD